MGQASHIQGENKWDLEETIRQTNDEKLLKHWYVWKEERRSNYRMITNHTTNSGQHDSAWYFTMTES